jgi:hypothetical protein
MCDPEKFPKTIISSHPFEQSFIEEKIKNQ